MYSDRAMADIEETPERIVVRRRARAWWTKWMGWLGVVALPFALFFGIEGFMAREWGTVGKGLVTLGYGVLGVFLLFRAPLETEIVVERAAKTIRVRRRFSIGANVTELRFSDVTAVSTTGASGANMSVVVCRLETTKGSIDIIDEGGFRDAQTDTRAIAEKLSSAIGVPLTSRA
jgi:hypothetical protein